MTKYIHVFKNLKKEKPEQPDYRVSAKIGAEFEEIGAGWIKKTKPSEKFPEGRDYLSISIDETKAELQRPLTSAGTKIPDFSEVDAF